MDFPLRSNLSMNPSLDHFFIPCFQSLASVALDVSSMIFKKLENAPIVDVPIRLRHIHAPADLLEPKTFSCLPTTDKESIMADIVALPTTSPITPTTAPATKASRIVDALDGKIDLETMGKDRGQDELEDLFGTFDLPWRAGKKRKNILAAADNNLSRKKQPKADTVKPLAAIQVFDPYRTQRDHARPSNVKNEKAPAVRLPWQAKNREKSMTFSTKK